MIRSSRTVYRPVTNIRSRWDPMCSTLVGRESNLSAKKCNTVPSSHEVLSFKRLLSCGALHASLGFLDRRWEGRRYRSGHLYEDLQEPPIRGGWQRDVNTIERLTSF